MRDIERVQTIIIGAGQAGLSVGYHLARRGLPFLILEANERVGDTWRRRWDSLRLFTPARFDGLDGLRFPAHPDAFPTKDEMGDYLESYAAHFQLPVRTGVRVDRVSRQDGQFVVSAGDQQFEADHVVVAMASYQRGKVPSYASELDQSIVQLHSIDYQRPTQLREGGVLIVGAGNSGAEIAMEAARCGHKTWLAGRDVGHIPFRIGGFAGRHGLAWFVLRFLFFRVLSTATPVGRKARPKVIAQGGPLIRLRPSDLASQGVERVPRLAGVRDGHPILDDRRVLDVANVIWCTGFEPGLSWIDLPVFDEHGAPRQNRGIVAEQPGLYFVGLHFLYALSSGMIHGVGRDADYLAGAIANRVRTATPSVERRAVVAAQHA